ncbi:MAG: hypothetical protein HY334_07055 [Armatimonadetes bacterium]|nr:hypothetical protein [Armatimonadota bacterium]
MLNLAVPVWEIVIRTAAVYVVIFGGLRLKLAVLETDGSDSIVPQETPVVRTRQHVRQLRRR